MIGLDTNVLVRYLTQDDQIQAAQANTVIENCTNNAVTILINSIVLCELSWVMLGAYKISKTEFAALLEKLLLTAEFEIEDRNYVWQALSDYRSNKAGFADALIGRKNIGMGCKFSYSFDANCCLLTTFKEQR